MKEFYSLNIAVRRKKAHLFLLIVMLVGIFGGGAFVTIKNAQHNIDAVKGVVEDLPNWKLPIGSMLLASYARWKAGDEVPLDIGPYGRSSTLLQFGQETNSQWFTDMGRIIIPYLVYEKVSPDPGVYPKAIFFTPYIGDRSFNVAGSYIPNFELVILNEKSWLENDDQADLLETLVHELIHAQGGAYLSGPSESFESKTSAATLEVLAAMCQYEDKIACKAFWGDIESYARSELRNWLRARYTEVRGEYIYQRIADFLWRGGDERIRAAKSVRYWADKQPALSQLIKKYVLKPWRSYVLPGLNGGVMDTELLMPVTNPLLQYTMYYKVLGMPFDDVKAMLGWLAPVMLNLYGD